MRNFRYPVAIPPLGTPAIGPDGHITEVWRRFFESQVVQAGGQGGDEIYDLSEGLQNTAALVDLQREQQRLAADIEALRGATEAAMGLQREQQRQAVDIEALRGATEAALARRVTTEIIQPGASTNSKIGATAATAIKAAANSSFDFWSGGGYGPGGSSASSATTRILNLEIDIDPAEYRDGDGVTLLHDYDLVVDGGCFDWAWLVEEVYRYGQSVSQPSAGAASSGKVQLLRSRYWTQGATAGRILAPAAATSGGSGIPILRSGIYQDELPASGDTDYDATGYTYLLRVRSTTTGSILSGGNAYENANDTSGQTFTAEDVNMVGFVLRQTGA